MFNVKNIAGFAGGAFVLSFFTSIIATHRAGVSVLRALIFGFIFGLIAVGIDFLSKKFLDGESDSLSSDSVKKSPGKTTANVIDIVLDDENLTEDEGPAFSVENNKRQLNDSDVKPAEQKNITDAGQNMENIPAAGSVPENTDTDAVNQENNSLNQSQDEQQQFKPFVLGKTDKTQTVGNSPVNDSEISELPDIGDVGNDSVSSFSSGNSSSDVEEDTEFAQTGNEPNDRVTLVDGSKSKDHNVETMAKAISTILKRE